MKDKETLLHFLNVNLIHHLNRLTPELMPEWGSMNAQQMVEHLALPFKLAMEQKQIALLTPEDKLEKVKNISLLSDRAMPKLFNNPVLSAEMIQLRNNSIKEAIEELKNDIDAFHDYFNTRPDGYATLHNIFGKLNYNEWLWFHYKHCLHHLAQFQLVPYQERL
jgi:hypothetical protein